jgi:GNAT superfamily N-acetyltransferase
MTRNTFVENEWTLKIVDDLSVCDSFNCGDADLNEYFHKDVKWHKDELLTQTYSLHESAAPDLILALLDFCNDSIKAKHSHFRLNPKIHYPFLPAVKLTRLGVAKDLQGQDFGTHALNMVKKFFTTDNRTGCRFLTVDAYNTPRVIKFYVQNGFILFTDKDKNKGTRALFFDLKTLRLGG